MKKNTQNCHLRALLNSASLFSSMKIFANKIFQWYENEFFVFLGRRSFATWNLLDRFITFLCKKILDNYVCILELPFIYLYIIFIIRSTRGARCLKRTLANKRRICFVWFTKIGNLFTKLGIFEVFLTLHRIQKAPEALV